VIFVSGGGGGGKKLAELKRSECAVVKRLEGGPEICNFVTEISLGWASRPMANPTR